MENAMQESMDLRGRLTLQLINRAGEVVQSISRQNHVVTAGRQLVAELFVGGMPVSKVNHIAVGTGDYPPENDQTQLMDERARNPIAEVMFVPAVDDTRVTARLKVIFENDQANDNDNPGNPGPLREAGIFNAATGGTMYNRVVFEPVFKTDAFQLVMMWDVTF
jgi:hypothetical protein